MLVGRVNGCYLPINAVDDLDRPDHNSEGQAIDIQAVFLSGVGLILSRQAAQGGIDVDSASNVDES
jgi:hypothetical protein